MKTLQSVARFLVLCALAIPFLPGSEWGFWALDGRGSLRFFVYVGALLATPALLLHPRGVRLRGLVLVASLILFGFLQWAWPRSIEALEGVFMLLGADRPVRGWAGHLVRPVTILAMGAVFGRYFCGWLCPMGALQELLHRPRLRITIPPRLDRALKFGKYLTAALMVLAPLLFQIRPIGEADPFTPVFNLRGGALGHGAGIPPLLLAFVVLLLAASVFVDRPFCRYLSPVGGLLALLARVAPARLRLAEHRCSSCGACAPACPVGAIRMEGAPSRPRISAAECIACRECEGVCPTTCLGFGAGPPVG
ncbi:MAG: 4Fe-4S binding protein [Pseudomonadota bacterium]